MIIETMKQGSEEWHQARLGRVTMSNAGKLLTGGKGVTRRGYLLDVASEILSGQPVDKVSTWDMERGILLEPFAMDAYRIGTGNRTQEDTIGLAYLDERKRISCSPDGLIAGVKDSGLVEIKCTRPRNHIQLIDDVENSKKYMAQMQGNMWIFDAEYCDLVGFCPEFTAYPLFVRRVYRDDEMIAKIAAASEDALIEIDKIVKLISYFYQPTSMLDVCERAKQAVTDYFADPDDIQPSE